MRFPSWWRFPATACAAALLAPGIAAAAIPSQFIAKQYSEALGRAPDAAGWQHTTRFFESSGCSTSSLQSFATAIFASAEYASKRYTPAEMVLTGHRAILSREPDPAGLAGWVARFASGAMPSQMANELSGSSEFAGLADAICSGGAYRQDWAMSQALDIGSGTWSQAQLESCISERAVCSVPPRTVVFLDSTVVVPPGKTLETSGTPGRRDYARQARLVRNNGSFRHLLDVRAGATVRSIWLSGQRHLYKNAPTDLDEVRANIWYAGVGGPRGSIRQVRSDFPLVRSHIVSVGPGGALDIEDSLLTGYTSHHTPDGTSSWITDGISQHASNGLIKDNDIIDPTDVGIVIFGHGASAAKPQASSAIANVIVHAGLSAYGSAGFDTTGDCVFCVFTGRISGTRILAGPNQHSDIMLFVGTAPWTPERRTDCSSGTHCGVGARMLNNTTVPGTRNQKLRVQVGLLVDGMLKPLATGNTLSVAPQALGRCYRGPEAIVGEVTRDFASRLQAGRTHTVRGCIGH